MAKRNKLWTAEHKRWLRVIAQRYTVDQINRLLPKVGPPRTKRGRRSMGGKEAQAEEAAEYAARLERRIAQLKAAGVHAYVEIAIEQDWAEFSEIDAKKPKNASLRRRLTAGRAALRRKSA